MNFLQKMMADAALSLAVAATAIAVPMVARADSAALQIHDGGSYPIWAHDYQTYTSLPIPAGAVVHVVAHGTWFIYGNDRGCSAAGSDARANNGGENGPWPIPGIREGELLVWFGGQVNHYTWHRRADGDYETQFVSPGGNLGFGPNDNHISDNQGHLDVHVDWR